MRKGQDHVHVAVTGGQEVHHLVRKLQPLGLREVRRDGHQAVAHRSQHDPVASRDELAELSLLFRGRQGQSVSEDGGLELHGHVAEAAVLAEEGLDIRAHLERKLQVPARRWHLGHDRLDPRHQLGFAT